MAGVCPPADPCLVELEDARWFSREEIQVNLTVYAKEYLIKKFVLLILNPYGSSFLRPKSMPNLLRVFLDQIFV